MKSLLFMICESDSDAAAPPLMCGRQGAAGEPQQSIIITNTLKFYSSERYFMPHAMGIYAELTFYTKRSTYLGAAANGMYTES